MISSRNVLVLCLVASLISFIPSIGAGFVFDFPGWQDDYNHGKFSDIINCFGYPGNHQLLHLVFYSFYKLFGVQGLPWYLFFTILHGLNGYLLYHVIIIWMKQWGAKLNYSMALLGVGIFLLHPYNVEPVVWKVCVHYLLSLMAILGIMYFFSQYLQERKRKHLIWSGVIYLGSLFLLEISFVTPLLITLAGFNIWLIAEHRKTILRPLLQYASMIWVILGSYLMLNVLTLGALVGHYGAKVHLKFDLITTAMSELKYVVKHFFFARYFSFKTKSLLFDQILSYPAIPFFFMTGFIIVSLFYFIRIRKVKPHWHLIYFGFTASMIFILPVVNLFFNHLLTGMNDRYSYMPLAFLMIGFTALLSISSKKWLYIFPVIYLVISIYLQQKTLAAWNDSTQILRSLKSDFRWHDAPYVFVLNSPDNYNGIVMTCMINGPTGIDELLDYQTDRPYEGKMYDIFQFNMTTPTDGVKVEQTGPMQLKVTFNQWGNWWWRNGIGGSSYENEFYKVDIQDYPYILTFKLFPEGAVIIYQDGWKWKEFDMSQ
ncbi:MAG: hypothetical protein M3R25_08200 [Bacteroidota bacterium]|nr:hypothetical protein [Bacteroidota bacterium]